MVTVPVTPLADGDVATLDEALDDGFALDEEAAASLDPELPHPASPNPPMTANVGRRTRTRRRARGIPRDWWCVTWRLRSRRSWT
jgi:hypothetical protein